MKTLLTIFLAVFCLASPGNSQSIRSGQTLQISITGVPVSEKGRLDNIYSVSSRGYITMWKIGEVQAVGLTKSQLANKISQRYQTEQIYTSPVFQVFSEEDKKSQDNQIYTVGGQVRAPGPKQWTSELTLYAAIQAAGGETPYGAIKRVLLYRKGKTMEFDLRKGESKVFKILPYDTIEVPQTNIFNQ